MEVRWRLSSEKSFLEELNRLYPDTGEFSQAFKWIEAYDELYVLIRNQVTLKGYKTFDTLAVLSILKRQASRDVQEVLSELWATSVTFRGRKWVIFYLKDLNEDETYRLICHVTTSNALTKPIDSSQ